jgi:AraC-like DNA-binding protein
MRKTIRAKLAFDVADKTSDWSAQKLYDFLSVFDVAVKDLEETFSSDNSSETRDSKIRRLLLADVSDDTLLRMMDFFSADDDVDDLLVELSDDNREDTWTPTVVELTEENAERAISELEQAIEEIAANNGYASSEPAERNAILGSLRSGIDALKSRVFTKSFFIEAVQKPLAYLSKKFTDSAIGLAAKKALEVLVGLL